MAEIARHKSVREIKEVVIYPSHGDDRDTPEFRQSKGRLIEDGHYRCWVCGATQDLQIHHRGSEFALAPDVDFAKLKALCEEWDPYGYGRLLSHRPIESVDDVRNMLVLCRHHHIERETGIHETTFPVYIIQKIARDGVDPVPGDDG